jgi:hypothetical protein
MALKKKKIYLEFREGINQSFIVKRVIGSLRHLPGEVLKRSDVESLCRTVDYEVIIDKQKK